MTPADPPAPSHTGTRSPPPLLERRADLAALSALLDAAREGNGRLAVIEGSAGIGKTRLLGEIRAKAEKLGMRVLSARGGELEREFAFGMVRQLFEPLLATASVDERADLLAGAASLAAPLFGQSALDGTVGDVSFAVLHGLYWVAANAALSQPTALLVDDLHWSDAPSLRWLAYAARRLDGLPLMLVLGTRPPEQVDQGTLVAELPHGPGGNGPQANGVRPRIRCGSSPARCSGPSLIGVLRCLQRGDRRQPTLPAGAADHARGDGVAPMAASATA